MAYKRYVARVGRRRALLEGQMQEANHLRAEANLPLWSIDKELARREPLLTQAAFLQKVRDSQAFNRFRQAHLTKLAEPTVRAEQQDGTDWQATRALAYRRMFIEHQIQQAWLAQAGGSRPTPDELETDSFKLVGRSHRRFS